LASALMMGKVIVCSPPMQRGKADQRKISETLASILLRAESKVRLVRSTSPESEKKKSVISLSKKGEYVSMDSEASLIA